MSLGRSRRLWCTELGTLNSSIAPQVAGGGWSIGRWSLSLLSLLSEDRGLSQRGVQSKNFNRSIAFLLHISFLLRVGNCGLLRL